MHQQPSVSPAYTFWSMSARSPTPSSLCHHNHASHSYLTWARTTKREETRDTDVPFQHRSIFQKLCFRGSRHERAATFSRLFLFSLLFYCLWIVIIDCNWFLSIVCMYVSPALSMQLCFVTCYVYMLNTRYGWGKGKGKGGWGVGLSNIG